MILCKLSLVWIQNLGGGDKMTVQKKMLYCLHLKNYMTMKFRSSTTASLVIFTWQILPTNHFYLFFFLFFLLSIRPSIYPSIHQYLLLQTFASSLLMEYILFGASGVCPFREGYCWDRTFWFFNCFLCSCHVLLKDFRVFPLSQLHQVQDTNYPQLSLLTLDILSITATLQPIM